MCILPQMNHGVGAVTRVNHGIYRRPVVIQICQNKVSTLTL